MPTIVESTPAAPSLSFDELVVPWERDLVRLEQEAPNLTIMHNMPEWWFERATRPHDLAAAVADTDLRPEVIGKFTDLICREKEATDQIYGNERYVPPIYLAIDLLQGYVPGDREALFADALASEAPDGPLHYWIGQAFDQVIDNKQPAGRVLSVLSKTYSQDSVTGLLGLGGDEFSDHIRSSLISEHGLRQIKYIDSPLDYDKLPAENQKLDQAWMAKAISAATAMPADEAVKYAFSVSRRPNVKGLADLIKVVEHFGLERLKTLSEKTGIYGLECYTIEQLERMERFVTEPAKMAEALADHDVTVVMTNRFGDYSDTLNDTAAYFEDGDRVLFFEVATMSDVFRRMVAVHKAGIQPSTIAISTHANEGRLSIVDDHDPESNKQHYMAVLATRQLIEHKKQQPKSPGDSKSDRFYSMSAMTGVARLVKDFMQPSRGIDDPEQDRGRRKIILAGCLLAKASPVKDLGPDGEEVVIGEESVAGQLARDLQTSGISEPVDIYGSPDSMKPRRTRQGIEFTTADPNELFSRIMIKGLRVRLNRGRVTSSSVRQVPLRKN